MFEVQDPARGETSQRLNKPILDWMRELTYFVSSSWVPRR